VLALPDGERGTFIRELARRAGWHPLCLVDEASVHDEVRELNDTCDESAVVSAADVSDADVRAACIETTSRLDWSEERGLDRFNAARMAIRLAEERKAGAS
jgi:hypothetical protein